MREPLRRLWQLLPARRRRQFIVLVGMMVLASLAETVSIGAVLPFLGVLASPESWLQLPVVRPVVDRVGLEAPDHFVLAVTTLFCAAAVVAGVTRLALMSAINRLSYGAGADLSIEIYRRTLYQPYAVHVARNSSEIVSGIVHKTSTVVHGGFLPAATLAGSSLLIVSIVTTLMIIDSFAALTAFTAFGILYTLTSFLTRRQLARNGALISSRQTEVMRCLQEGLGGIRDVLIDGSQEAYCDIYERADFAMRRAEAANTFIAQTPKYVMEALGMVLIAALALTFRRAPGGLSGAIPVLGALALGAQRLMPPLQQVYWAWSSLVGSESSLRDTVRLLEQPLPEHAAKPVLEPIAFERCIELRDVGFRYSSAGPWVFRHLDLTIPKGARVGLKGATGSGKSTLTDVVMGLLEPTEGAVLVDGQPITERNRRSWQMRIAHVPQSIYLADSTVAENIALGVPGARIDPERVRRAARQARIADDIARWQDGYETRVGERGVRLSGGQRQRIGIARALYKGASVIVLDEATSALDDSTERLVMESIEGLGSDLTLLIIAHRLTTLRACDQVVEVA